MKQILTVILIFFLVETLEGKERARTIPVLPLEVNPEIVLKRNAAVIKQKQKHLAAFVEVEK